MKNQNKRHLTIPLVCSQPTSLGKDEIFLCLYISAIQPTSAAVFSNVISNWIKP